MLQTNVERIAAGYGITIERLGNSVYACSEGKEDKRLGNWLQLRRWTAQQWRTQFEQFKSGAQS